jgi:hypothetical protein
VHRQALTSPGAGLAVGARLNMGRVVAALRQPTYVPALDHRAAPPAARTPEAICTMLSRVAAAVGVPAHELRVLLLQEKSRLFCRAGGDLRQFHPFEGPEEYLHAAGAKRLRQVLRGACGGAHRRKSAEARF